MTAAVVALEDNDERGVTVLPASLTVTEGGAAENYTVVLGSEPTGAVTVSVTTDLADTSVRVDVHGGGLVHGPVGGGEGGGG